MYRRLRIIMDNEVKIEPNCLTFRDDANWICDSETYLISDAIDNMMRQERANLVLQPYKECEW